MHIWYHSTLQRVNATKRMLERHLHINCAYE